MYETVRAFLIFAAFSRLHLSLCVQKNVLCVLPMILHGCYSCPSTQANTISIELSVLQHSLSSLSTREFFLLVFLPCAHKTLVPCTFSNVDLSHVFRKVHSTCFLPVVYNLQEYTIRSVLGAQYKSNALHFLYFLIVIDKGGRQ